MSQRRPGRAVAATTAVLLFAPSAWAAGDEASAEALFLQARDAMGKGDFATACPMLEESYRLVPGVGTKFNLGDCYEHLGRTASAWANFREAASASRLAGQKDRESAARARADRLEPSLCRMTMRVAPQDNLTIVRDGAVLGPSQWALTIPVDPGTHVVEAKAPGKTPWSQSIPTGVCPALVSVDIPVLGSPPSVLPSRAYLDKHGQKARKTAEPVPGYEPVESTGPGPARAVATWGSVGLGLIGVAVGTVFGINAMSLRDKSNQDGHCSGNSCDDIGKGFRNDSLHAGTASTISFVAGGAFLVLGTVLWLTSPSPDR